MRGQMCQGSALHVNERVLAGRMHAFQHKLTAIICVQVKVGVVFARQAGCRGLHTIQLASQACGIAGGDRNSCALFQEHAQNVIGNT